MNFHTLLQLGRVSNLPTVWANTLCGALLSGQFVLDLRFPLLLLATSLSYMAGMFLNDAFDADHDRDTRPDRPIPSGSASRQAVFSSGFIALFVAGLISVLIAGDNRLIVFTLFNSLAIAIVLYDSHHKNNAFSPVIMGLCRALVILLAAAVYHWPGPPLLWLAAGSAWLFVVGLTYTARQENRSLKAGLRYHWPLLTLLLATLSLPIAGLVLPAVEWPAGFSGWSASLLVAVLAALVWIAVHRFYRRHPGDIPFAVTLLIAALSILDAVWLSAAGHGTGAMLAIFGFVLTLYFQRFFKGT